MTRRWGTSGCAAVLLVLALHGCGGGAGSESESSTTQQPQPSQVIGEDGAAVSMALSQPGVSVRVARDGTGAPPLDSTQQRVGSIYQFSPMGLAVGEAEIRVPFDQAQAGNGAQLVVAQPGGVWTVVTQARQEGGFLVARVPQLSYAVVIASAQALGSRESIAGVTTGPSPLPRLTVKPTTPISETAPGSRLLLLDRPRTLAFDVELADAAACAGNYAVELRGLVIKPVTAANWAGFGWVRIVSLGEQAIAGSQGTVSFERPFSSADNGAWFFSATAVCRRAAARPVPVAYLAVAPRGYDVRIAAGELPVIAAQPADASVIEGDSASFAASATGSTSLQWERSNDGGASYAAVPGASGASFTLVATLADDGARLRLRASNASGSVFSNAVRLNVAERVIAPTISLDPVDQSVIESETASFSVDGSGKPSPTVQWQQRRGAAGAWADISAANGNTYVTPPADLAADGQQFRAVLANRAGQVESRSALLTVRPRIVAPAITSRPQDATVQAGSSAFFSVAATGTSPLNYRWLRNGSSALVNDQGSSAFVSTGAADIGTPVTVTVEVSNAAGSASASATLTITSAGVTSGTIDGPNGAQLVVPAGALSTAVDLQVNLAPAGSPAFPPSGFDAAGAVYAITPHGTTFAVPATVRIPFDPALVPAGRTPVLLKAQPGGSFAPIETTVNGNFLEAAVSSLSYLGPASASTDAGALRFTEISGRCGRQALTGHIWCWGSQPSLAFGSGLTPPSGNFASVFPKPVRLSTRSFGSFVSGADHVCGISNGFEVWCIGDLGITGEPTFPPVARWVKVALPQGVVLSRLAAAGLTVCGIGAANSTNAAAVGRAYCWGDNLLGQLGRGPQFLSPGPFAADAVVGGSGDYVALGASGSAFCAVRAGGGVECWGSNIRGEVPGATGLANRSPFPVAGVTLDPREGAIAGGAAHFCGLRVGGAVVCWGHNFEGQIGIGTAGTGNTNDPNERSLPALVPGVTLRYLRLVGDTSCGLNGTGDLVCWGASFVGQLADGTTVTKQTTPLTILQGNLKFGALAGRNSTLCGLTAAGETYCWGSNRFNDFGTGSLSPATSIDPVKIDDLGPFQSLP
jgi:alpha-tubulin suppressor-like RCC1 family protein